MQITGATRLFPIIGFPVAGVFSPPAFNRHFSDHGLDAVMFGLDITPEHLESFWTLLRTSGNLLGCSVTYPHKQAAFQAVDEMTGRAARLGALNTIRHDAEGRLSGDATDGLAMVSAMHKTGFDPQGKTVHVMGAGGGAGLAIVDCLCEQGVTGLIIDEIDTERRGNLHKLLETHWPNVPVIQDGPAEILVNATTLGKSSDQPLPFGAETIAAAALCCDVVTGAQETPFMNAARHAGKAVVTGNDMGAEQLAVQLAFIGL